MSTAPSSLSPDSPSTHPAGAGPVIGTRTQWHWVAVLLAGTVAGLAAWALGETSLLRVEPVKTDVNLMGQVLQSETAETLEAAEMATALRTFGVLGALTGAALGLAGGWVRGPLQRAWIPAALGLMVGAVAGAAAAVGVMTVYQRQEQVSDDLTGPLLLHLGLWVPIGAAGGVAYALGRDGRRLLLLAALGGAVGVFLGTIAFEILGATIFPLDQTARPISSSPASRLLARLLIGMATSLGIVLATTFRPFSLADRPGTR